MIVMSDAEACSATARHKQGLEQSIVASVAFTRASLAVLL
jgi:hypothetical protein